MRAAGQIIDTTLTAPTPDESTAALAVRADLTAERGGQLREQTSRAVAITSMVDERRMLLGVVADSQQFFSSRLGASWVPGYLAGRGLAPALERVAFGYAPPGWTGLVDHLARLGYSDAQIEAAGMGSRARTGRLVDRFRDRLILPVHDHAGELVGFIGRLGPDTVDDRYSPRYLNSPATPLFNKSDLVFGLGPHAARIQNGWQPVLCEGPLDAIAVDIAAAQTGTAMVGVAACGTAFTAQHAARLTDLVGDRPICLALDADPAGRHATETVWRRLTDTAARPVTVAALPAGADPADLVATGQEHTLADLVRHARPAAQEVCDHTLTGVDLDGNPARRLAGFRQLLPDTTRVPADQRVDHVLYLAHRLDIDPTVAAAEAAAFNPTLLADRAADRVVDHCHQLARQLDPPTTDQNLQDIPTDARIAAPTQRLS
jgi:DNA primase